MWRCIKNNVRRKFVKAVGNLNSEINIILLRSNLLPDYKNGGLFQLLATQHVKQNDSFVRRCSNTQHSDLKIIEQLCWKLKKQALQKTPFKISKSFGITVKKNGRKS